MKRMLCLLVLLLLLAPRAWMETPKIDINLSGMNNLLSFMTAKNVIETPEKYIGKRIQATGWYTEWQGPDGAAKRFMILVDLSACCFIDGSIQLELLTDAEDDVSFPAVEQQFEAVGVVEMLENGSGALRLEQLRPLDHWQSEVYW